MTASARFRRFLVWGSALLLAACTGSEPVTTVTTEPPPAAASPTPSPQPSPTAAEPAGTVSIWLSWTPEAIRQLNELISAYQQRHPEVEFSVSFLPADELRDQLSRAFEQDAAPTVFIAPSSWGPELAQSGLVVDLSQLPVDQIRSVIQPLAWDQVEVAGRIIGLPIQLQGNVLYRNRELEPVPAATVEDLVDAAQGFRGTLNVGMSLDYGFGIIGPLALACGGPLIQEGEPLDLEGPEVPCWLELLQELSNAGPVEFNTETDQQRFGAGTAAWQIDSTEQYAEFGSLLGAEALVIDPWPVFESTGEPIAGFVWTENVYFSSGVERLELDLAWSFVASLLSADSQLAFSNPNRAAHIPVHAAVPAPPGVLGQMNEALLGGAPRPLWAVPEDQLDLLERAARAVSLQGTDVETALRRAMDELAGDGEGE